MTTAQETAGSKERFIESWPKSCSCGAKITDDEWEKLKYVGIQQGVPQHAIPDLELRNCSRCGSTLAIAVPNDFV